MGACCSNLTDPQLEVAMNQPVKNASELLNAHAKSIVKIQALFRGVYTRRRVKQRYGFQAKTMSGMNNAYAFGESNYDNERVQEIKRQFGDFRYPAEQDDG